MAQMNGGAAVVETLRAAGVTHVFGLLGSSTMEVYDALYDARDIKYVASGTKPSAFTWRTGSPAPRAVPASS